MTGLDLEEIRSLFTAAFAKEEGGKVRTVQFEVITGGQEATWEHQAAQVGALHVPNALQRPFRQLAAVCARARVCVRVCV